MTVAIPAGRDNDEAARRAEVKLSIRAPRRDKEMLEQAARIARKTLSQFVLDSARQSAVEAMLDRTYVPLTPAQWDAFRTIMDAPARPLPALRDLMAKTPAWER